MSNLVEQEISKQLENDVFTPETIAWRLLVDGDLKEIRGQLLTFTEDENITNNVEKVIIEFEILITIYMEMIFGWYKLLYLMENDDPKKFIVDLSKITLENLENPFSEKFKILGYILSVEEITDMEYYDFVRDESYCRIALRDLDDDHGFFFLNRQNIDPEKRYHFILNSKYPKHACLRNIYSLVKIKKVAYKINFLKIY